MSWSLVASLFAFSTVWFGVISMSLWVGKFLKPTDTAFSLSPRIAICMVRSGTVQASDAGRVVRSV